MAKKKIISRRKAPSMYMGYGGIAYKTPQEVITEQQIIDAKAEEKANKNGWVQGLNIFGQIATQVGGQIMSQGMSNGEGVSKSGFNWGQLVSSGTGMLTNSAQMQSKANGGVVEGDVPVEVEGQEVGETPQGEVLEFQGPSHEEGGIDTELPEGTVVYSDRIKKDGKTMADRKKLRERVLTKIDKKLNGERLLDIPTANSLGRRKAGVLAEDMTDLQIQEIVDTIKKKDTEINAFQEKTGGVDNAVKETLAYGTSYLKKRKPYADKFSLREDDPNYVAPPEANKPRRKDLHDNFTREDVYQYYQPLSEKEIEDWGYKEEDGVVPGVTSEGDMMDIYNKKQNTIEKDRERIAESSKGERNQRYDPDAPQEEFSMTPEDVFSEEEAMIANPDNDPFTFSTEKALTAKEPGQSKFAKVGKAVSEGYENSELSKLSLGDMIGIASTYKGARAGLENTLENRAGDTPNVNYFKNFGDEALKTIEESKGEAKKVLDINKKDINRSRRALVIRNRNSARSVNTMRSLDIASEAQANIANTSALEAYSSTMQSVLDKKANTQLTIDNVKMGAETQRDLADRQDRDNFFTQKGKDLASMYEGYQMIGKHLNDVKEREMLYDLLEQQGTNVGWDRATGETYSKYKKRKEADAKANKTKKG